MVGIRNSAPEASTSRTNKRPRSRSASDSVEDRPAPAMCNPERNHEHAEAAAVAQVHVNQDLPERRYEFDPDDDLLLAVGEECPNATPITFKVDSRAFSRPSTVFKQIATLAAHR